MKEALAGAETLEPLERDTRASSNTAPAPGTEAGTPVLETEVDKAADSPRAGADNDTDKVFHETLAA
jgi:hypothetical protein